MRRANVLEEALKVTWSVLSDRDTAMPVAIEEKVLMACVCVI